MTKENENLADVAVMNIEGELTIFSASDVNDAVKNNLSEPLAFAKDIEIDLSQVTEIDGAGLQILLMTKQAANRLGAKVQFSQMNATVKELVSLSNTQTFLETQPV